MNSVTLIGNIGKEPEAAQTTNGTTTVRLSLATNRKVKGEQQTQWHTVKAYGKTAEIIRDYAGKGDKLAIQGRIDYWQSEKDGTTRYFTDIVAHTVELLGARSSAPTQAAPASTVATKKQEAKELFEAGDDLPF